MTRQDKRKRYNADYVRRRRENQPVKAMLARAKSRAKRRGIEFDLTEADVFIPTRCPVLDIEMSVGDHDAAPSLDRINSNLGYVAGNILVISNRANRLKNNGTPAEHMMLAKFFERLQS